MMTGGRLDDFEMGWAVLINRGAKVTFAKFAHFYDAIEDGHVLRAICGHHIVPAVDAMVFAPGNWLRCSHCQQKRDRQWN
jgi:hypothetical protein